jgi:hypothetical protein
VKDCVEDLAQHLDLGIRARRGESDARRRRRHDYWREGVDRAPSTAILRIPESEDAVVEKEP